MHDALNEESKYAVGIKIDSALQVLDALGYNVPKAGPIVLPFATPVPSKPVANTTTPKVDSPPSACDKGCETKLSELTLTKKYHYEVRAGMPCEEKTLQLPKNWPGTNLFLHVTDCTYGSYGSGRHATTFYWGATDRTQDYDLTKGVVTYAGYSGQGYLVDDNGQKWSVNLKNAGELNSFKLDQITLSVKPPGASVTGVQPPYDAMAAALAMRGGYSPATSASSNDAMEAKMRGLDQSETSRELCPQGCSAKIRDFKLVQRYHYVHPTYGTLECEEKVFQLPPTWPGGPYLHSVVCKGPNARGVPITLVNFRLAKTDRMKDIDVVIVFDDANGTGRLMGPDRHAWEVKIYGTGDIETMEISMTRL